MKGIILAGGHGTRLMPLTKVTNKHLLPVGAKPMIYHPIEKLITAGVTEIMIVTGVDHMGDVVALLGSGRDFGGEFTYRVQDEAGGIAQALGLARTFVGDDPMVVVLGDNVFSDDITPYVNRFRAQEAGARILIKEVPDPERFGVAEIQDGRVVSIVEKPTLPKSNYCVTGIYMYPSSVFEVVLALEPSGRGELEISDVNAHYCAQGTLEYDMLAGWWTDAGTHASWKRANELAWG
jgi:glucose-1-phosphate thymidylyltransferase